MDSIYNMLNPNRFTDVIKSIEKYGKILMDDDFELCHDLDTNSTDGINAGFMITIDEVVNTDIFSEETLKTNCR